ncbi:hypothetical protein NHX12_019656 [Muraenolepis orangiensis]|uniref:Uncharacterized protein n=1 Tax=Muraenolepis orangiensis TaxID=630683 RepID=A0A9Q0IU45_9TELE|nr:hypothetical protein NHX12_019656 [Muraenolepis orangiensis]
MGSGVTLDYRLDVKHQEAPSCIKAPVGVLRSFSMQTTGPRICQKPSRLLFQPLPDSLPSPLFTIAVRYTPSTHMKCLQHILKMNQLLECRGNHHAASAGREHEVRTTRPSFCRLTAKQPERPPEDFPD